VVRTVGKKRGCFEVASTSLVRPLHEVVLLSGLSLVLPTEQTSVTYPDLLNLAVHADTDTMSIAVPLSGTWNSTVGGAL